MYLERDLVESGHSVIALDLAGYGGSAAVLPRRTAADHAGDVIDLLDELEVDGAVLVGFAFGAGVILSAHDYDRVGALVSVSVPSAAAAPYGRMRGSIVKDWPRFAARSAQAILSDSASPETKSWIGRIFEATNIRSALAGLDVLEVLEPTELPKRWNVPATFAHGSADPMVPAAVSQRCAELFGGEYREFESSSHLVVIDQKEALLNLVQRVVKSQTRQD